ncbi:BTB/POZ domain-containing protein 9 [Platysternon megacephalum]|uniref:BTB/POZ domain-containing protein 9 n=1 Tax=Platysternon megacephalum TaxID=55544 RepID=A0A4D9EP89_9SAUR|nr:BTB/POZ domain-containing protein 9 [Platysternon megacephalum]
MNWLNHLGFIRTALAVHFTTDMFDLNFPREEHHHQKRAYEDIISIKSCPWRGITVNCWVMCGLPSRGSRPHLVVVGAIQAMTSMESGTSPKVKLVSESRDQAEGQHPKGKLESVRDKSPSEPGVKNQTRAGRLGLEQEWGWEQGVAQWLE